MGEVQGEESEELRAMDVGHGAISAKLFLRRGTVEDLLKKNENRAAMHNAMG
jgi:hypothetical protein